MDIAEAETGNPVFLGPRVDGGYPSQRNRQPTPFGAGSQGRWKRKAVSVPFTCLNRRAPQQQYSPCRSGRDPIVRHHAISENLGHGVTQPVASQPEVSHDLWLECPPCGGMNEHCLRDGWMEITCWKVAVNRAR